MLISIKISRNSAFFSGSDKPRMLFFLLINVKMPTIVIIIIRKSYDTEKRINGNSCINIGTTKINNFPFRTNGKLIILGVPALKGKYYLCLGAFCLRNVIFSRR